MKKNGKDVSGSPFSVVVEAPEPAQVVGKLCDFPLNIPGLNLPGDLPRLTSTMKRPCSSKEEPVKLTLLSDNTLNVTFVPESPGEHLINIKKRRSHVTGSPFRLMVEDSDAANLGSLSLRLEESPVRYIPQLENDVERPREKHVKQVTFVQEIHPVGRTCEVVLNIARVLPGDFKKLTATIKRPNGKEQQVTLVLNPDNSLGKTDNCN